jgi:hypothetical protein
MTALVDIGDDVQSQQILFETSQEMTAENNTDKAEAKTSKSPKKVKTSAKGAVGNE